MQASPEFPTDLRRAEEALRLAELNYRSIFDNAVEGMYRVDDRGRVVMANLALARMLGYATPEAMLAGISDVARDVYVDPEDRRRYRERLKAHGVISGFETRWRRADGTLLWVSISGRMVNDPAGGRYHLGSAIDITERKREERLLALEHSAARLLAEARDEAAALEAVLAEVARSEGWECARYFEVDEAAGLMRVRHTWHDGSPAMRAFAEGSQAAAFREGEGLAGQVWRSGEALWVPDVGRDARVAMRSLAARAGVHAALVVPVKFEGKVIGALSISSASIRQPDERLGEALVMVCGQVGQFLQRKQAERVVRESEARFRSLTELSSDFYWETDAEHRVSRMTHGGRHRTILGGALIGTRRWEAPSTLPGAEGWAAHRATMESHQPFRDFEFGRLDGEGMERNLSISGEPVFDEGGRFAGYRGIGKDITARKREERLLALEHAVARRLAEAESAPQALSTVMESICRSEGWDCARYFALDEDGRTMQLAAAWTSGAPAMERYIERSRGIVVRPGEGLVGEAWQRRDRLWVPDVATDARLKMQELAREAGLHGALSLPVVSGGEVIGVFSFMSSRVREPDERLLRCITVIGSLLGQFRQRLEAEERRVKHEQRLAFLAQFDPLTGLPNRALLADRFSQMIVQAKRHGSLLGVLFIDLDHFKHVNDTLGHAGGDELLKEAARRLQASVRPGDTVARISGDEFAVLLGDLARAEDAALVAQKILDRLAEPVEIAGKEIFVSASVGIAAFPADGAEAESLLRAADAAMYRAKQAGRNAYQFFTPEIDQRTRARAQLGSDLRRALERNEFELAYQPKYDLRTGLPCGAEALLRWRRPDGEVVGPAQFIPVLEETGLIVPVGEWVLRRACTDLKGWQEEGLPRLPVSVNVSARQFRQPDLDARIRALVDAAGLDPSLLELEITESQLMHDPEHGVRMVKALHEHGFRIAIDDFGTGYSSLSYLTRFPVSALKIDRSFVADALGDPADAAIVRTIIDMAHTLGFLVVAEGVENQEQASFLRGLGCQQAQGYLFARPMAADGLRALMASLDDR
jgi:diguanylate cyclase (GGDEF)-like protein/PAS domain S-box-containing protein